VSDCPVIPRTADNRVRRAECFDSVAMIMVSPFAALAYCVNRRLIIDLLRESIPE